MTKISYAIVYLVDGEPIPGFGPFSSMAEAEDAFDTIREDPPAPNEYARTVTLVAVSQDSPGASEPTNQRRNHD